MKHVIYFFWFVCLYLWLAFVRYTRMDVTYTLLCSWDSSSQIQAKKQIISSGPWHLATARGKLYFSTLGSDITTAPGVLGLQQGQVMESKEEINKPPHHSGEGLV